MTNGVTADMTGTGRLPGGISAGISGGISGGQSGQPMPEQPFEAPWHAAVFALTVHLHKQRLFTWPEWAAALGQALAGDEKAGHLDGSDDYYRAWLATLQGLLTAKGVAATPEIEAAMKAWEDAYLATPHGEPVTLVPRWPSVASCPSRQDGAFR